MFEASWAFLPQLNKKISAGGKVRQIMKHARKETLILLCAGYGGML